MPERIHTKFSDNEELSKAQSIASPSTNPTNEALRGKKRKRNEKPRRKDSAEAQALRAPEDQRKPGREISDSKTNSQSQDVKPSPTRRPSSNSLNSKPSSKPPYHQHNAQKGAQPTPHLNKRAAELLSTRQKLPIYPHADSIRQSLAFNDVLILTGETGSGKSTQVPQFLATESWCTACIAITQPRRVAAISLARRVADEMGSLCGNQSPASRVGYSVRFDHSAGPSTRVKFLTEGMLLQEILRDPELKQYSAVIVDEVHERSVNVDLILGFLKGMVGKKRKVDKKEGNKSLKVVVMSATADVEGLVRFFSTGPGDSKSQTHNSSAVSTCFVEGRQYPVKTVYLPTPTKEITEDALKKIFQIHLKEPLPGDILVFLTGQDAIEELQRLVDEYAEGLEKGMPKVYYLIIFRPYSPLIIITFLLLLSYA